MILVAWLVLPACLPYFTPPLKVAVEGGGAIGQRAAVVDGEQELVEGGALVRFRAGLAPLHLFPRYLARRFDLNAGYLGEFYPDHGNTPRVDLHGAFMEASWHPMVLVLGPHRSVGPAQAAGHAHEGLLDAEERAYLEQEPSSAPVAGSPPPPEAAAPPAAHRPASPALPTSVLRVGLSASGEALFTKGVAGTEAGGGVTVAINLEWARFFANTYAAASRGSVNLGVGVGEASIGIQVSGSYRTIQDQSYGIIAAGLLVRLPYMLGVLSWIPGTDEPEELPRDM